MSDEQYFRLMSVHDLTYSSLFSDEVFENPKWDTYADVDYLENLENTDSEGFHYFSDQSRISFNNPPVEMPLEISRKTRDESVNPKGPNSNKDVSIDDNVAIIDDITIDPFNEGLSNSDSIYDSLDYNASSNIIESSMNHKFIDSSYATEDQDQIWCILTDELSYPVDDHSQGDYYFQSENKPGINNISLFNAANSNIPCRPIFQSKYSKHADTNSPDQDTYCKVESNQQPFINDRYPEVTITLSTEYNPSVDLCATCLWSDESATKVDCCCHSWFH